MWCATAKGKGKVGTGDLFRRKQNGWKREDNGQREPLVSVAMEIFKSKRQSRVRKTSSI